MEQAPVLSEDDIEALIEEVDRNGKLTLNLTQIVKRSLERIQLQRVDLQEVELEEISDDDEGAPSTEEDERPLKRRAGRADSDAVEEEHRGREYGIEGWGSAPLPQFDKRRITPERKQEIRNNPWDFIEFVYQNRRFKLKPIGTIEPVPKRIYFGPSGAPYYYKTRGPHGEKLELGDCTKVYLKKYQKQQCFQGRSNRSKGLAGYIDVNGECLKRPPPDGRITATRPSKTQQRPRPV
jgi:hypothetical protein